MLCLKATRQAAPRAAGSLFKSRISSYLSGHLQTAPYSQIHDAHPSHRLEHIRNIGIIAHVDAVSC